MRREKRKVVLEDKLKCYGKNSLLFLLLELKARRDPVRILTTELSFTYMKINVLFAGT